MKNNVLKAAVLVARCQRTKKPYGIRFEEIGGIWCATWAFKIDERNLKKEKYDEINISGQKIIYDSKYPGCPYCEADRWFSCGDCGHITCNDNKSEEVKCAWCGRTGILHALKEFKYAGGAM